MKSDKIIKDFVVAIFPTLSNMTKKELIDAIASSAKLTKADAGRLMASMTKPELEAFLLGGNKKALIDQIAENAKITKADAGRALDATVEAIYSKLKTVFGGKGQITL